MKSDREILPLLDTLPLRPFETPVSLISRIAAMNRAGNAREFCRDFFLSFDQIIRGRTAELEKLAVLVGADLEALVRGASVTTARSHMLINGEDVTAGRSRRTRLRVCVDCVDEDISASPALSPDAAIACRAFSLIDPIRTCPLHNRSWTQIADGSTLGSHWGDYSIAAGEAVEAIDRMRAESVVRPLSDFEKYLMGRCGFGDRVNVDLLEGMSLTDVTKICERMGTFLVLGRKAKLTDLDEEGMWRAGQAGFEVLTGGVEGVRSFVTDAYESATAAERGGMSNTIFGRFHYFLNSETAAASFLAIKQIIADRLSELLPYGPDDAPLFGIRFTKRHWHTLISAERQYDIPYRTIRKEVMATGLFDRVNASFSKTRFIIPADALHAHLTNGDNLVRRADMIHETGVYHRDLPMLEEAGLLVPVRKAAGGTVFRRGDVWKLQRTLFDMAKPQLGEVDGMERLYPAFMKSDLTRTEVIRLILAGAVQLTSVQGERSLESIRVEVAALQSHHAFFREDTITYAQAIDLLQIRDVPMRRLIKGGRIRSYRPKDPAHGKLMQPLLMRSDVEAWHRDYISLWNVWKRLGGPPGTVLNRLGAGGANPAFPYDDFGVNFYRRADVVHLLPPIG